MTRLALVIVALVVVSAVASFCIYYFITDALGSTFVTYTDNYSNNSGMPQLAWGYKQLQIVQSVCEVTNIQNKSESAYGSYFELYIYNLGDCNTEKIEKMAASDDNDTIVQYVSLSTLRLNYAVADDIRSYIAEKTRSEKLLLLEKLYDIYGILLLINSESQAWAYENRAFDSCRVIFNDSADCYHAILAAEDRVVESLESKLSNADFTAACRSYYNAASAKSSGVSGSLDSNALCQRVGSFMKNVYERRMQDPTLGRQSRYYVLLLFSLINSDNSDSIIREINTALGNELPDNYRASYVDGMNKLYAAIAANSK